MQLFESWFNTLDKQLGLGRWGHDRLETKYIGFELGEPKVEFVQGVEQAMIEMEIIELRFKNRETIEAVQANYHITDCWDYRLREQDDDEA